MPCNYGWLYLAEIIEFLVTGKMNFDPPGVEKVLDFQTKR